jgi:hypothetical protein
MRRTFKTMLAFAALACMLTARAQQKLTLDNIQKISLRNSGPIMHAEELTGYFYYYISDKIDKHTNEYTIQILDDNLKQLKKITFQDDKDEQLLESAFNDNTLLFLFWNKENKTMTYRIYGMDGKEKMRYQKDIDKKTLRFMDSQLKKSVESIENDEGMNTYVYNLGDRGYVSLMPKVTEEKDNAYEIDLYMSDTRKQLNYTPVDDSKYCFPSYLGATDSIAYFEVLKKEGKLSRKVKSFLLGINLYTAKKAFEIETETEEYKFLPMGISTLNSTSDALVMGSFYSKEDHLMTDKILGIAALTINSSGKITNKKWNTWEKDFSKFLNINSKGKIEDIGYLYFHKIIQTEDGNVFAIGEGYKKTANGWGIAATALSAAAGGYGAYNSVTKLTITNMVLIKFNKDFKVMDAVVYEKNKNNFSVPGGDYVSPHTMAVAAKSMGAYDYSFTSTDKFHTNFYVGYEDYEKNKDYKGSTFHSISYNNSKLTTDKINLASKATSLKIMPGKAGYIVITEYFKKEKKLDIRLEKLN